ncbi:DUF3987 domain-containing protein [uncultured Bilophila sp.]|uniref:DUF3987 domain-containing protein n=1 Tax=uncultured Bilophila sp. TaxID=529385 RepID=UPI00266E9FEC|nr:DUF3987 domain-containing protein [uncultured Bilophila sp.]
MNYPCYPGEAPRLQMLRFFHDRFGIHHNVETLNLVPLPAFTLQVVSEMATAKAIPVELSLLGFLPSIAAADRGHSRVVMSDGSSNSLSLFIEVGADSGSGKSRALEEALDAFADWQRGKETAVIEKNKALAFNNRVIEERIRVLMREFARTGDAELLATLGELTEAKADALPMPHLLLNDVTEAAYSQHLVEHGVAIRLESDGMLPPKKAMRLMTKAWSGESTSRKRMTSPDGRIEDPFVVDLVMTQPEFFYSFISTHEFLASGLMARTLLYRYQGTSLPNRYTRPMDEDIRRMFREKLFALLNASDSVEKGSRQHRIIAVSSDAEDLLGRWRQYWKEHADYGGPLYRVKDFVARMPQHVLRLAGCLYLAEYPVDCTVPISLSLMETSTKMMEVFLSHVLRWTIRDYEDVNVECCRAIMIHVLEKNFYRVPETELKQALRHQFKAADVNVALYYLVAQDYLRENHLDQIGIRKRGRPTGREFYNPYHDRNGYPF